MVKSILKWLQEHRSPTSVTGSLHRLQLHLALRYMELGTGQPQVRFISLHLSEDSSLYSLGLKTNLKLNPEGSRQEGANPSAQWDQLTHGTH